MRKIKLISAFVFAAALGCGLTARANDNVKTDAPESVQQGRTVAGTVSDASGAVIGASVSVKGTSNGTVTDSDGRFTLRNVPAGATIVISYLGYTTQEIAYNGQANLSVTLAEDTQQLGEVVVTALGITKQARGLGYAMSTIKSDELTKVGTPNFATALYGKASGVRINAAPGGVTSGVSMTIRGIGSIFGNTQPLLVMDGVPIRNGNANTSSPTRTYDLNGRIEGNGIIDINPQDIESISILKGASATALYGSEASNGVILVTSKKGAAGEGVKVDFNATFAANMVAYMPKVQTEYGPGRPSNEQTDYEIQSGGFIQRTWDQWGTATPQQYLSVTNRGDTGYQYYFGPKYDSSKQVLYWNGQMVPYEAMTNSPYTDFYRNGSNQNYNVAITHNGARSNTRFSYTYVNDVPTIYNSSYDKHNFNLVGGVNVLPTIRLDYSVNYLRQNVFNRPRSMDTFQSSYSGITGSFSSMSMLRQHTRTSLGYRYETYSATSPSLTPTERYAYDPLEGDLLGKYWDIYANNQYEINQRLIGSVAPTWTIIDGLKLRGRLSTDISHDIIEREHATERPLALYPTNPGGYYGLINHNYDIYYGDIMFLYDKNITSSLNLTANAGWQGRQEQIRGSSVGTTDGLAVENWFNLAASRSSNKGSSMEYADVLRTAYFASVGLSYDRTYYLEVTARQEQTSTLPKGMNNFFYPSANASYIFSEQLKDKLDWYDYGKLRVSYAKVGNAPTVYATPISYTPGNSDGYVYTTIPSAYGNEKLKPENKYEFEIGLENRFFGNRAGLEVSFYNNRIEDQLLLYEVPSTTGVSQLWQNMGSLNNKGVEISLSVTPIQTSDLQWDLNFNYAWTRNTITELPDVLPYLKHGGNLGNVGGATMVRSYRNRPMGDVYTNLEKEVVDANTGKSYKIVAETKYVNNDKEETAVYMGNLLPTGVGGVASTLTYKNFKFDFMVDYCIGGLVADVWLGYATMMGQTEKSLQYRDEAHGGLAYHYEGDRTLANIVEGEKAGYQTFHDGVALVGVEANSNGTIVDADGNRYSEVRRVIPAGTYYKNSSRNNIWGWGCENSSGDILFDNTYVKMRELSLAYQLPRSLTQKFGCSNLSVSVFGRNLFYFYKNLPDFDAEGALGTGWGDQGSLWNTASATRSIGVSLHASF
jgi:TonB-linked SusC/RagA family outer membrane protein